MYLLVSAAQGIVDGLAKDLNYEASLLVPCIAQRAAWWDVAVPCFHLAKQLNTSPQEVAQRLVDTIIQWQLSGNPLVSLLECRWAWWAKAVQWYLNLRFSGSWYWSAVIERSLTLGDAWGRKSAIGKTMLVESPSPNTNKPLHLGHVRNMLLGSAVTNILRAVGYTVVTTEVVNDRGIHICKSMLAYQKTARWTQPNKKSDHFVGDFYVAYSHYLAGHPEAEYETTQMLQAWEQWDPEVRALWEQMNRWALDWFAETYKRFGVTIQARYFESDHYEAWKELVIEAYEKGVFGKDEKGNIVAHFDGEGNHLPPKVLLRADGTSIYITQDLALAAIRNKDFAVDGMIYVVWNEQEDHFKALFLLLKKLWFARADRCYHLSYGMIRLPDWKMKSREGNVVDADTLADDMHRQAFAVLQERHPELEDQELHQRAEAIALWAISFFMLKYEASKDFVFDVRSSLSFEWETWPYIQYTAARCASLLRSGHQSVDRSAIDEWYSALADAESDKERYLLVDLSRYEDVVADAARTYDPSYVARYLLDLAHSFNSYYHDTRIRSDDALADVRLTIVKAVLHTMRQASQLLNIVLLDEM
jgi:arginyl-tRNA synthetase